MSVLTDVTYYKVIVPGKDEPKNGGSYVKDTKDAHEKYNFKPEHLKLKGYPMNYLR
jgi:hypothetical protein